MKEKDLDKRYYKDFEEEIDKIGKGHDVVPVRGDHPFFILYTSGTTG